jgi:hypothetical protein
MSNEGMVTGGCLCGAVRFTAAPANRNVDTCHCGMCRRWAGGPFFARDCADTLKIEDASNLGVYRSSEWAERCFCKKCGTALFFRLVGPNIHFVSAEAFDDREGYTLTTQVFIDDKPAYYGFANETHSMTGAEVFAAFAPPGDAGESEGKRS